MKTVLVLLTLTLLVTAILARAETENTSANMDFDALELPAENQLTSGTESAPDQPPLNQPQAEGYSNGRAVSPSILQIRELETEEAKVKWSFGIGAQYFLKFDPYMIASLEMAIADNLALGFLGGSLGSYGTANEVQGFQTMGTINFHSDRFFRGLWVQGGGGITVFKTVPTSGLGEVYIYPTLLASLGWRWRLPDNAGRDDAFSVSVSGGAQAILVTSFSQSQIDILPMVRFEANFGF